MKFFTPAKKVIVFSLLLLVLLMAACTQNTPAANQDAPTLDIDAIKEEIKNTLVSEITQDAPQFPTEQPTQTPAPTAIPTLEPTPLPTETPVPTEVPTEVILPTATRVAQTGGTGTGGCLVANFVSDVTVPDGTVYDPGTEFTKTWKIYNNGSCWWDNDFKIVFVSGDAMGSPASISFNTGTIMPGENANISLSLVAPSTAGTYTGYWMLQTDMGEQFGLGSSDKPLSLSITVD